jgi:hypothetical protein
MKKVMMLKSFIGLFLIISIPRCVWAEGTPVSNPSVSHIIIISMQDTIRPPAKSTAGTEDKNPDKDIIKVVPKSRRQPVPVPVNVNVKPIIKPVIKPVIKPLIRVLH